MKIRDVIVGCLAAVVGAGAFALPLFDRWEGVGIDTLFWLRQTFAASSKNHAPSPVVVIAIDEETYRRPPFRDIPKAMWTKQIAQVIDATLAAGAMVVGFDIILSTSAERYLAGFDREFLLALRRASADGKIVLGKVQHQAKPIGPHRGQSFAVGHEKNIRSVNIYQDDDGIIRRVPLMFRARTVDAKIRTETSMALELASRALDARAQNGADGTLQLGDYVIPGSRDNSLTLNFGGADNAVPTYSLADIHQCAKENKLDFLKRHLAGKIVLLGSVLDVEDRKLTSKRFIAGRDAITVGARCTLPIMDGLYRDDVFRDTIPGVYLHATAVNNLLAGNALRELGRASYAAISLLIALLVAAIALVLTPLGATIGMAAAALAWLAIATWAFDAGVVLPLFDPLASGGLVFAALLGYRVAVSDRDKRYLRKAFSYYLPAAVIERMVSQDALPTLGGESREVTIMISDIASFTTLSEGLSSSQVASFLNEYLTEMSDVIEAHGGFIEMFVADEITGVFGAPLDDPDHAAHAVEAALVSRLKLAGMTGAFGLPAGRTISARFGINTGEMLVGNIGSHRRFSYAAMGDAANVGSRLEGANKYYGTDILVGDRTYELCRDRFEFREIDRVRVKGREAPVTLYLPICRANDLTPEMASLKESFAAALLAYRQCDFERALAAFEKLAHVDTVSAVFVERVRGMLATATNAPWDGVTDLSSK